VKLVRIKQVAEVRYGLGQPPPPAVDGTPILRATNIERGKINRSGMMYANRSDLPLHRTPLLEVGEILVVRSGAYTGDSAIVTAEWAGAVPGYDLRLTVRSVDARFLAYQLLSDRVLGQIELAKMRAAQPHLNAEDLGDVTIAVAGPRDECAIADFLDVETARIDRLIRARRRMLALIAERLDASISHVLDRPDWPSMPLKWLTMVTVGIVIRPSELYEDSGVPCLRGFNVRPSQISDIDLAYISAQSNAANRKSMLGDGDVVVVRTGRAGSAAVVPDWAVGGNCVDLLIVKRATNLEPRFLEAVLNSAVIRRQIIEQSVGALQAHFNTASLASLRVPAPARRGQLEAIDQIDTARVDAESMAHTLTRQIELLQERRQALITAAVTGQLEIPGVAA
jgi:type I restriction enzyme S subunit